MTLATAPVQITCFSDVLCVWAYVAERRIVELKERFNGQVSLDYRFIPLFGDTETKFMDGWKDRGGFDGYAAHVEGVLSDFEHVTLNPDTWTKVRPASSAGAHLLLKAVQLCSPAGDTVVVERLAWRLRQAFFVEAKNIARTDVQMELVEELELPRSVIEGSLTDGTAFAALCRDAEAQQIHKIEGSPTYLLNNGRQKLYGNVGFKIIEANIQELLKEPSSSQASWC